jgi:alkylation response protein AidB-like acyl-CoA dehydrogenase
VGQDLYGAGRDKPIIHYQAVGYALADVAMKIEACRAFSWRAGHYLDRFDSEGQQQPGTPGVPICCAVQKSS